MIVGEPDLASPPLVWNCGNDYVFSMRPRPKSASSGSEGLYMTSAQTLVMTKWGLRLVHCVTSIIMHRSELIQTSSTATILLAIDQAVCCCVLREGDLGFCWRTHKLDLCFRLDGQFRIESVHEAWFYTWSYLMFRLNPSYLLAWSSFPMMSWMKHNQFMTVLRGLSLLS